MPHQYAFLIILIAATIFQVKAETNPNPRIDPILTDDKEYRYHYISLTNVTLPSDFLEFSPDVIDDRGTVYGTVWNSDNNPHIAIYTDGIVTVLQPGAPVTVNAQGTIGGYVINPQTGKRQAAIFRGENAEIIPLLPDETETYVQSLNDSDAALIWSEDPKGLVQSTYRVYQNSKFIANYQLPTGSDCPFCWGINNQGVVSGVIDDPNVSAFRAIRFQPPYNEFQLLAPLPSDNYSNATGINDKGNTVGTSYPSLGNSTKIHHGIWDQHGNFELYYEGDYYFGFINNDNLIVLSQNFSNDNNSYLLPSPGVLLNLEDLINNRSEVEAPLVQVTDLNNRGDIIGRGACQDLPCPKFLLQRISTADRLFNWAESIYPNLFPNHPKSQSIYGYDARIYENGKALGVKDGNVYYYDGGTSDILLVGTVQDYLPQAVAAGF
jgi:hypothetical protein